MSLENLTCRICGSAVKTLIDFGQMPPANSLAKTAHEQCDTFPLEVEFCGECKNLQLGLCLDNTMLYEEYVYETPESESLDKHYNEIINYLKKQNYIRTCTHVLEVGSNLGHFLNHLKPHVDNVQGVEPAKRIAKKANELGLDTINDFFSTDFVKKYLKTKAKPDAIFARHCFAHNKSIHELLGASQRLLSDEGFLFVENAYALDTIRKNEFDQIYHEHMYYLSVTSMSAALHLNGLKLIDALRSDVHGGSIMFIACQERSPLSMLPIVSELLEVEKNGLTENAVTGLANYAYSYRSVLQHLLHLIESADMTIYAYGATAKASTLINFLKLRPGTIKYCVDNTPIKQHKFMPGTTIEIVPETILEEDPPDYILLTAWNYSEELVSKIKKTKSSSSLLILPFPNLVISEIDKS